MKFYRVSYIDSGDEGCHIGYSWHATKRAAESAAKNNDNHGEVEPVEIVPTKAGILAALNEYADYPNNG